MFTGCGTALVTPFQADGRLDEVTLRSLVRRQIEEGIDFLVPCGSGASVGKTGPAESVLPLLLPAAVPAISLPTPAPVRLRPIDCQGPLPHICVEPDGLHRWLNELDRDDAEPAVLLLLLAAAAGQKARPVVRGVWRQKMR